MSVPLRTRLFTVREYYRMAEAGILRPEERVELIQTETGRARCTPSPESSSTAS